jgi:hypothetical protein
MWEKTNLFAHKTHDGKVCRPRKTRVFTVTVGKWQNTSLSKVSNVDTQERQGKAKPVPEASSRSDKEIRKIPTISTGVIV